MAIVLVSLITGLVMFGAGYALRLLRSRTQLSSAEARAKQAVEEAARKAEGIIKKGELDAKEFLNTLRQEFEEKTKERRNDLTQLEKRLHQREELIDRKIELLDRKEKELGDRGRQCTAREQGLKTKEDQLDQLLAEENEKLKSVAGLTSEQA